MGVRSDLLGLERKLRGGGAPTHFDAVAMNCLVALTSATDGSSRAKNTRQWSTMNDPMLGRQLGNPASRRAGRRDADGPPDLGSA